MQSRSRRAFLAQLTRVAATYPLLRTSPLRAEMRQPPRGATQKDAQHLSISVDWDRVISRIPANMLGLSYEASQLSAPDFFSPANRDLIHLFRRLSPQGVLRLGGNLSEYTTWSPDLFRAPAASFHSIGADPSSGAEIARAPISRQSIRNLRAFLDQTQWKAIYGINLAQMSPENAAKEAQFAARTLGPRLIAFQIGNEPDHYVMNHLRKPGYRFEDYFSEWKKVHDAILDVVPTARFAGPDIAQDTSWIRDFAQAAPKSVILLTGHHYAVGPPTDPSVNIGKLLAPDKVLTQDMAAIEAICRERNLPYVMAETNSCYNAGKAGVSDVFAASLWAVDYFLQLAASGQQGVYFHGGANGRYTPIAGGSGKPFAPRPIYHGLQMAGTLQNAEIVAVHRETELSEISTYALRSPHRLAVINKGATHAVIHLAQEQNPPRHVQRLQAPSPESQRDITLITQPISAGAPLSVPAYSAAVFTLQ
ncbi:hypothetical protein GCM10011586_15080 [Silvibacterium dinghuense]|nr:hypothetical protein GCM10011586_15080 [Silvibacterium dinghuense]